MLGPSSLDDYNLIFGSQILDFDVEWATELRSTLLQAPSLEWILDVLRTLPKQWCVIADQVQVLQSYTEGHSHLDALALWIRTGDFEHITLPLPNILLTPLVVATHFAQYGRFLEVLDPSGRHLDRLQSSVKQSCGIVGFCTGQLSAAVISHSSTWTDFRRYGATAIRSAMAIGAVVDATNSDCWKSLVVASNRSEVNDTIGPTLDHFSEAYVSVLLDEKRMTISVPQSSAASLAEELKQRRISVGDIALQGAFHKPENAAHCESLLHAFKDNVAFELPILDGESVACSIARDMLLQQSDWPQKVSSLSLKQDSLVMSFGATGTIPPSLPSQLGSRLWQFLSFQAIESSAPAPFQRFVLAVKRNIDLKADDAIAVVGMACKTAGAQDLGEFWDLLCNGPSQHVELSCARHDHNNEWRDGEFDRKVFASFMSDADSFDHKFFKKSPREAASTDPQHRLMMQTAYQALEQAGYFSRAPADRDTNVGCYVGIGLAEYERNVASHPATAYAVTGNLMSFAAGKVSHHFGWRGPSIAVNAACSSSGVAIDLACKALLRGECSAALAGGVNAITRPEWFNFLGAGSFLSSTGQCKPFDAKADGYSRGEGVGAVYLKRLSTAIEQGDKIHGIIVASRTLQNQHSSTITAPTKSSLSELFSEVVAEAGLQPKQISFVEAHGTGTQVGDTIEYESIRKVLGGPSRDDPLFLGAVKGLVGHTESASGILALVKTLLAFQHKSIPPHHSFSTINPTLNPSKDDMIAINTQLTEWNAPLRAAMVNNYGASGANFAQVVIEPCIKYADPPVSSQGTLHRYPFWLCGLDENSITRYASKLLSLLRKRDAEFSLKNLSHQMARQSNRLLAHGSMFTCSSVRELEGRLDSLIQGARDRPAITSVRPSRPVILCFGGQTSRTVALDRGIYENCAVFRNHLDKCDNVFKGLGLQSMFPDIFNEVVPADIVSLQSRLFAVQYSCAKSWIDCGVNVVAVVGHSFGELTAMCVSGVFSLSDMATMIIKRAQIIRERWDGDTGAMLACDGQPETVEALAREVRSTGATIDIACYNGPRSFTLSGSVSAIQLAQRLANEESTFKDMKVKALDVTHAFHSGLVEPFLADVAAVDSDAIWREPHVYLERATAVRSTPSPNFVAEHLRSPVYFYQAASRLYQQYPESIWLEAGSNSGVTNLIRSFAPAQSCHFQSINVGPNQSTKSLADATISLWEQGESVHFWAHHQMEPIVEQYVALPPYQFEKCTHWLKPQIPNSDKGAIETEVAPALETLWTFCGYQDADKRHGRFRVNTKTQLYRDMVMPHVVAQTVAVCPSTLQMVLAVEAIESLVVNQDKGNLRPHVQRMENHLALCLDDSSEVFLDAERVNETDLVWKWRMSSGGNGAKLYVSGIVKYARSDDADFQTSWATYDRLADKSRCKALLDRDEADGFLKGRRTIYKAFAEYVDYRADRYKGLHQIAGRGDESAGRITIDDNLQGYISMLNLIEPICQVAGIYLSSMTERDTDDMYISHGIGQWILPHAKDSTLPKHWEVYARHQRSDKGCISDVFAFDAETGALSMAILGIGYNRIAMQVLRKVLSSISTGDTGKRQTSQAPPKPSVSIENDQHTSNESQSTNVQKDSNMSKRGVTDVESPLRSLLGELLGVNAHEIKLDSDLMDMGVDSLLAMELARDVEKAFSIDLRMEDLFELTDFRSLLEHIQKRLGISTGSKRDSVLSNFEAPNMNGDQKASDDSSRFDDYACSEPICRQTSVDNNAHVPHLTNGLNGHSSSSSSSRPSTPQSALADSDLHMDALVARSGMQDYLKEVNPKLQELCVGYIVDAFEKLGSPVRTARVDDRLPRVTCPIGRAPFLDMLYDMLEVDGFVRVDGPDMIRTGKPLSTTSTEGMIRTFLGRHPDHTLDCEIVRLIGPRLAAFLAGEVDGVQLTFGSKEGKKFLPEWYEKAPVNVAYITKMEQFLVSHLSNSKGTMTPVKILEIGGGTAGTTKRLVRSLTESKINFEYTFSDISSSLVAAAKRNFKGYDNMRFQVVDVEHQSQELMQEFDVVVTTNCVHATHNLQKSVGNIRSLLRPDGLLLMLEMTMNLPWINFVFGVFEGWWLFEDGRSHALASETFWKETFEQSGLTLVDRSGGELADSSIQTIFVAQASRTKVDSRIASPSFESSLDTGEHKELIQVAKSYIQGFQAPQSRRKDQPACSENWVLLTGATGSLGAHLLEYLLAQQDITGVICLNRKGKINPEARQMAALKEKRIFLSPEAASNIRVLESDTSQPMLGLSSQEYAKLVQQTSFIVHNGWPMSVKKGLEGFEPQFQTMRNLIELARESAGRRSKKIGFQFVSSIAAQTYELDGKREKTETEALSPGWGYGRAKLICENMLRESLMSYPDSFRAIISRVGQVSGSKLSGYWNKSEHLPMIMKSSQTLGILPAFEGELSWCSVDDVASILGELLLSTSSKQQLYHVENPRRVSWPAMSKSLAQALDIPRSNIIPLDDWIARVRQSSSGASLMNNPAAGLVEHLSARFIPADCGQSVLDTMHAEADSPTLKNLNPVDMDTLNKYVEYWRSIDFLK